MNPRFSLAVVALVLLAGAMALTWTDRRAPETPLPDPSARPVSPSVEPDAPPAPPGEYVLAVSWHPTFCEQNGRLPECRDERSGDFSATSLVLHGLWPQRGEYCGVEQHLVDLDKAYRWTELPALRLGAATRRALDRAMPGAVEGLDRHEWLFHGTCSGTTAEVYFARALDLLDAVNASTVRDLLAGNVGRELARARIRAAFDEAFGSGAGRKVRLDCDDDGDRALIAEMRINLQGDVLGDTPLRDLIAAARNAGQGCPSGIVDPAGDQ